MAGDILVMCPSERRILARSSSVAHSWRASGQKKVRCKKRESPQQLHDLRDSQLMATDDSLVISERIHYFIWEAKMKFSSLL